MEDDLYFFLYDEEDDEGLTYEELCKIEEEEKSNSL